jgi:hypothetical protein
MPLFAIRRDVGQISPEDVDAAGLRATICAAAFTGLRWKSSYWDPARGELRCYYEARNAKDIEEHSLRSAIPCDEIVEVNEIMPEAYAGMAAKAVPAAVR